MGIHDALRSLLARQADGPAAEIYRRAYAIDAQCFAAAPPREYVTALTPAKVAALRTSGLTAMAMCMTSGESQILVASDMFAAVMAQIVAWDDFVAGHSDLFLKVTRHADLERAKASGRIGFIYNFQMTEPFGRDLRKLATFVERGVRQIQLTGGSRNYVADSDWEPANAGLSQFGFEVVDALNTHRVLVDLSHVGERSGLEAILASRAPTMFSHSGCTALCPHPRNVSDRNIRAMADRGGVFCVYNQSGWLTTDPQISIDHFIAHVAHAIDIGGEDHVGVGTDQDAVDMSAMRPDEVSRHQDSFDANRAHFPQLTWPVRHMRVPELSHPRRLLHLCDALQQRGYRAARIEKIIGGNYARLFRDVAG